MKTNRESDALNARLEEQVNPEILANLANLEWLIDPDLFAWFREKIVKIVWENPWSEDVVVSKIWEIWIKAENLYIWYQRQFRSIGILTSEGWIDNFLSWNAANDWDYRLQA